MALHDLVNPDNVIFGQQMVVWRAPYVPGVDFPDIDVEWGDDWNEEAVDTEWEPVGYTQGGANLRMNTTRGSIRADQERDDLFQPITGRDIGLSGNLLEWTLPNIIGAYGQGTLSGEAATETDRGYSRYSVASAPRDDYYSIGVDALHPGDDEAVRLLIPKGQPVGNVTTTLGTGDAAGLIAFDYQALPSSDGILEIVDIIAAGAGLTS